MGVYVDDFVIIGSGNDDIHTFKEEMKTLFTMSDLGLLSYYLDIEVAQMEEAITLCQSNYVGKILQATSMSGCNTVHMPIEIRHKIGKTVAGNAVYVTLYCNTMGCLRHL